MLWLTSWDEGHPSSTCWISTNANHSIWSANRRSQVGKFPRCLVLVLLLYSRRWNTNLLASCCAVLFLFNYFCLFFGSQSTIHQNIPPRLRPEVSKVLTTVPQNFRWKIPLGTRIWSPALRLWRSRSKRISTPLKRKIEFCREVLLVLEWALKNTLYLPRIKLQWTSREWSYRLA